MRGEREGSPLAMIHPFNFWKRSSAEPYTLVWPPTLYWITASLPAIVGVACSAVIASFAPAAVLTVAFVLVASFIAFKLLFAGDRWTVFGGVRSATHGKDQFGSDGGYSESGPFVGSGYSFRTGEKWSLNGSLAVNFLTFKDESGQQVDDATGAFLNGRAASLNWRKY